MATKRRDPSSRRLRTAARLLAGGTLVAGLMACGPRVVRVPVSPEDIERANELVREGDVSFVRRDYYPALEKYVDAAKLNPNSEIIQNKVGISYSALGFYNEAGDALKTAIALNRKFVYAYNNLGTVYFAQGDQGRAQKHFRKAIELAPRIASFHINLGQSYLETGDFEKGMREMRRGLDLDPNVMDRDQSVFVTTPRGRPSAEKSYNLARIYAATGDVEKAIRYLREAIDHGFTHLDWVDSEPDFDIVRDDEQFALFLSEARMKYRVVPETLLLDFRPPRS